MHNPSSNPGDKATAARRIFLGRYETVDLLGEGGMGKVYLARDLQLPRQVVVKVMHEHIAADQKFCERFKRETDMTARFSHPYAVMLFDASVNDPQGPCIIMEHIRGITLDELLVRNTRLSPVRVGRLLGQLCEVLQAAHGQSIIHRDLKPSNLMVVDPDTPYEKIKVMDFGLAKMIAGQGMSVKKITESHLDFAVGTPGYICPELVRGEQADHRGDLYSVGVILYEMLSGRLPFSGGSTMDILLAHATEPPPFFAEIGGSNWVPPVIEEVVRCCLAKDPQERPQSARDLAERYETALAHQEKLLEESLPTNHPRSRLTGTATPTGMPAYQPIVSQKSPDPRAVVHRFDAWMPEGIALFKLRGFVNDAGGDVVESVPGRIRVRLDGSTGNYTASRRGALSWLGIGKPPEYDIELCLEQIDPIKNNQLHITVVMRVPGRNANDDPLLHARCDQIFCDLRAYLMGNTGNP